MPMQSDNAVSQWLADWARDPQDFARSAATRGPACAARWSDELAAAARAIGADASAQAPDGTDGLATLVGAALLARGWRVALAESCTGGGLGAALTAIAGSSAWVEGGCITYSNAAKTTLLGVPPELIAVHGAVSGPVVEAMALGTQARLGTECAVAVSGIAGPSGGNPRKPVGTVWLAWAGPAATGVRSQGLWFPGGRAEVRAGAVWVGLTGLLAMASACALSGHGGASGVA